MNKAKALSVVKAGYKVLGDCSEWFLYNVTLEMPDGTRFICRDIGICEFPRDLDSEELYAKVIKCAEKQANIEIENKTKLYHIWRMIRNR